MATVIFIILYIASLISLVKAIRIGRGLFFPDFRRIDEAYFGGAKNVWNTWHGKLGYYLLLLFHLSIIFLVLYAIYSFGHTTI